MGDERWVMGDGRAPHLTDVRGEDSHTARCIAEAVQEGGERRDDGDLVWVLWGEQIVSVTLRCRVCDEEFIINQLAVYR